MTTTYEHSSTTTSGTDIGLDRGYLASKHGILKIVECVLDMIAFICASVEILFAHYGGGWVQFVTMSAFITTLLLYLFHLFRVIYKLPGPWGLIELIYYAVYSLLMLTAGIVCAANAGRHGSIAAGAFFTFAATVVYIIETFFLFRAWQAGRGSGGQAGTTTTTTTTTHETYETRVQY